MYTVRLDKHRATWNYFTTNPQGGGFGSNYCGPKYIALERATANIPVGAQYRIVCNGRDCGIQIKSSLPRWVSNLLYPKPETSDEKWVEVNVEVHS